MHIKIQGGGGGHYANTGSSGNVAAYLENGMQNNQEGRDSFFNHRQDNINHLQVIKGLDENKKNLMKADAKFYVITISPSQEEIRQMGGTIAEQKAAFKKFIKNEVMQCYAENFNKGLSKDNIRYYACVHEKRKEKPGEQLHAHIVVSRKSDDNRLKLSPQTNHKETGRGPVKGGFNRSRFVDTLEKKFDQIHRFNRELENSFKYRNAVKKGRYEELGKLISQPQEKQKQPVRKQEKEKGYEIPNKGRGFGLSL